MLRCIKCGTEYAHFRYRCDRCSNVLMYHVDELEWRPAGQGVWRYQSMLPVKKRVSMSEGGTPLIRRREVKEHVYLKLEGDNPTGSFKDRGTTVVISDAMAKGYRTVSVASTGNMGASVAAYSAYANIEARVFIPEDVPREKVSQIEAYGANLIRVDGPFSKAVERSEEEMEEGPEARLSGINRPEPSVPRGPEDRRLRDIRIDRRTRSDHRPHGHRGHADLHLQGLRGIEVTRAGGPVATHGRRSGRGLRSDSESLADWW